MVITLYEVCIVGSEGKWWNRDLEQKAKLRIQEIIIDAKKGKAHTLPGGVKVLAGKIDQSLIISSGECPYGGVDIWVKEIALELDVPYKGYPPEVNRWNDKLGEVEVIDNPKWIGGFKMVQKTLKGYRSRNLDMIRNANNLYVIEPTRSGNEHLEIVGREGLTYENKKWWEYRLTKEAYLIRYVRHSGGWWTADQFDKMGACNDSDWHSCEHSNPACQRCKDTGEISETGCPKCKGTGRIKPLAVRVMIE